ncbi:MAG: transketolase [Christensenellaceae bacterium]|nr:transketolase [Christensenellaceae bacterium]
MNTIDKLTVNTMRTMIADAVQKANSGHPGLAIGAAPMALALFEQMKHNPQNPEWRARDRFILSAGHASMLEYSLLHLFGYDVSMEDIKNFRQLGSKTAGHPEYGNIKGIEATTGPLGQGFAMAVGMAMAEKHMASVFNRSGYDVVNNYTYVLMGDGCMMEGIAAEAASLAGTLKLNKLIALYDSNKITIEGSTDIAFTEDVASRFASYGWNTIDVADGEAMEDIRAAIASAKSSADKPTLIIVHTKIAHGTPKEGSASSHGSPLGSENIASWKTSIEWGYEPFTVPEEVRTHMAKLNEGYRAQEQEYDRMITEYAKAYPGLYEQLNAWYEKDIPEDILNDDSLFEFEDKKLATRVCSGTILNKLAARIPNLIGGSADLGPSNNTELKCSGFFSADTPDGRNIHFGIREFAMAAICNGLALYGGIRPYCATFLVFSDYLKPAERLSALMKLGVLYIFTHDSIGVGEDGPTHQPIEHVDMLRATPNTYVFRPADGRETAASYIAALKIDAPSILVLSRQGLPQIEGTGREALKGGYVLKDSSVGKLDAIILATGSEVDTALKARELLESEGLGIRVVSMPCMELFDEQSEEYRESVLPSSVRNRVAVEALGGMSWYKYVGLDGRIVSMNGFGASAPGDVLFRHFGFTAENIASITKAIIG